MIPAEGERLAPPPTLRAPFIVKLEPVVGVPLIVSPEKARVPELLMEPPVFVMVPPAGDRFPLPPTERVPVTPKLTLDVLVPLKVTPLNVKVPELLIVVVPVSKVIVPPVGARVFPEDTVKALLIV